MKITGRMVRQIVLFSLTVITVPMVVFPERLGTDLARASWVNIVYELIFYGLVFFLFNRQVSLVSLVQSAGICVLYRLALGAAFGLLVAAVYSMNVQVCLTLGLFSYLPAVLIHVAVAPFILKPAVNRPQPGRLEQRVPPVEQSPVEQRDIGKTTVAISRNRGSAPPSADVIDKSSIRQVPDRSSEPSQAVDAPLADTNGFERATRYIGEHGSVQLAAVVDAEGLLLSQFSRGGTVAEDLAPLALVFTKQTRDVLDRAQWGAPEKIDVSVRDKRVVGASEERVSLMVVAERQADDVLNIRINQALEIIRKYMAERYSEKLFANAERSYVPSTE